MDAKPNRFVWYELMSRETGPAAGFYTAVIGWEARDGSFPGQAYTLFSAGESTVAGLLPLPAHLAARGVGPHWTGYIGVEDLAGTLERIRQAGGAVHHGPEAVPGVGSLAVAGDPQGAVFSLLQPEPGMSGPPPVPPGTPGHAQWHELHASDQDSAFAFYAGLFGWTKGQAMDMGPMGTYQTFHIGDVWAGGMMTRTQQLPHPVWLFYFNVDSAGAAAERVTAAGGTVLNGPHQVPGGGAWILQGLDPQGAMFALVGPA
jgi:predicted enzyme related to lactoylglutathione lyase